MLKAGEVHVWRISLDEIRPELLPPPAADELARAARLRSETGRARYLRSHAALRAILAAGTNVALKFSIGERGKPYLPAAPEIRFNLSRSGAMALVGLALGVEVGVDVERVRALPECEAIAARFFPPSQAAAFKQVPAAERQRAFFRRWTRFEAMLKAQGVGLAGVSEEFSGPWTVADIDVGEDFAGAVAAMREGLRVVVQDFSAQPLPRVP